MDIDLNKIKKDLVDKGFNPGDVAKVDETIKENLLPAPVYTSAVLFLGSATVLLVVGGILLPSLGKPVPEALWTALGAGIGGLAGIFMGNR